MTLNKDKIDEIYNWGLITLVDTESWTMSIKETIRRMKHKWYGRYGAIFAADADIFDEYIFYFSNEDDAALFKLTWV